MLRSSGGSTCRAIAADSFGRVFSCPASGSKTLFLNPEFTLKNLASAVDLKLAFNHLILNQGEIGRWRSDRRDQKA